MLKRSGQGPYRNLANAMAAFSCQLQADPNGSSLPSVIANAISRAIRARRPKTRYVAGKLAKPMLFVRQWGG